ncbi:uncharacterized protein LOC143555944 [Bidens hawaiensis]|uniref:uncharacterized protein LOC143555944 n=1 Tax=Bidens hawaiensis TaxID=980011 RepID=UPI00404AF4FC
MARECTEGEAGGSGKRDAEKNRPRTRAYMLTQEQAKQIPDVVTGTFLVNGISASVLFDSGASRSFVDVTFFKLAKMTCSRVPETVMVETASDTSVRIMRMVKNVTVYCDKESMGLNVISMIKSDKMLRRGCGAYLAYVVDTLAEAKEMKDVPIVCDYHKVFPEDLPGLPPEREVEFQIDIQAIR